MSSDKGNVLAWQYCLFYNIFPIPFYIPIEFRSVRENIDKK